MWAARGTYRVLDTPLAVRCEEHAAAAEVERLLGAFRRREAVVARRDRWSLVSAATAGDGEHHVFRDCRPVLADVSWTALAERLADVLSHDAAAAYPGLLLDAVVLAAGRRAVALPATGADPAPVVAAAGDGLRAVWATLCIAPDGGLLPDPVPARVGTPTSRPDGDVALAAVVWLDPAGGDEVEAAPRSDIVAWLMSGTVAGSPQAPGRLRLAAQVAAGAEAWRVGAAHPDRAARALGRLLA